MEELRAVHQSLLDGQIQMVEQVHQLNLQRPDSNSATDSQLHNVSDVAHFENFIEDRKIFTVSQ